MPHSTSTTHVSGAPSPSSSEILTPEALTFIANLHSTFNATREQLLERRATRQAELDAGEAPDFLPETADVRNGEW